MRLDLHLLLSFPKLHPQELYLHAEGKEFPTPWETVHLGLVLLPGGLPPLLWLLPAYSWYTVHSLTSLHTAYKSHCVLRGLKPIFT